MEVSQCNHLIKPKHILSLVSIQTPSKLSTTPSKLSVFPLSKQSSRSMVVMSCANLGPRKGLEYGEDEWAGIGEGWKEKCRGEGIEEVMECLEREAIMGEDHGREPDDYYRRAHIFHKSNTVFQALKQKQSNSQMLIS